MESFSHKRLSVSWLNGMVLSRPEALVRLSERIYENQIEQTGQHLAQQSEDFSILLVSGPSASTKTTTAGKLRECLLRHGVGSVVISLDDFFIDRAMLPRLPDGSTDFESIRTLDLPLLNQCFGELLSRGEADFPVFDFTTGKRAPEARRICAGKDSIVIMEGIHALDPLIAQGHDPKRFRKLYISPNSEYFLDDRRILGIRDVRLIRRLVRDYFHRANAVESTLQMWVGVVASEVVNIIPYRTQADYVLDSAILYEPNVFQGVLAEILSKSSVSEEFRPKVDALTEALRRFVPLGLEYVPKQTVLREFLQ